MPGTGDLRTLDSGHHRIETFPRRNLKAIHKQRITTAIFYYYFDCRNSAVLAIPTNGIFDHLLVIINIGGYRNKIYCLHKV